nr:type IV toxin-antitoxin system AbiEi family antitoxin domain-containing protein [Clostridiales bacterium]
MQKSNELLLSIAEKNNGVIRYSDVEEKDISKDAFFRFIKNNDFEKVSHGIYLSPDVFPDEMFLLQLRFPRIVFSNETALYL